MDWLLPYDWAAALSASGNPMTSWGSPGTPPRRLAADNQCPEPRDLDIELVRVLYEVLVQRADCAICDAPLEIAVDVEPTRGSSTVSRIVVVTHCRGSKRHRHMARVVERNGELRFGQLKVRDRTPGHW
jgi:hypothetical protein